MTTLLLFSAFALATVAGAAVLADSGLRWWSAIRLLRYRLKQGHATSPVGQRPVGSVSGFQRGMRGVTVRASSIQRAA